MSRGTMARSCIGIVTLLLCIAGGAREHSPSERPAAWAPQGYRLIYASDFARPEAINDFVFTDPKAWQISRGEGGPSLELAGASDYKPKYRSPFNIAVLKDKVFTDVVFDCQVCSTVKPYPHQDMCFFYGMVSPTQFYYTHIAVKPDPHAHNCFIVNNAERVAIGNDVSPGVTWGVNQWHHVRIERRGSDGTTTVYFDDMGKPIMQAHDKTFRTGYIGFGSFDDKGRIRDIHVYAPSVEQRPIEFYHAAAAG